MIEATYLELVGGQGSKLLGKNALLCSFYDITHPGSATNHMTELEPSKLSARNLKAER